MFSSSTSDATEETVIGEGLKIEGKVIADGHVRVNGRINGDLRCSSLVVSDKAQITGTVVAESVVVDGLVEGPIRGEDVVLKSNAHVTGDIHHSSLTIEKGAVFDGRSKQNTDDKKSVSPSKKGRTKKDEQVANDDTNMGAAAA